MVSNVVHEIMGQYYIERTTEPFHTVEVFVAMVGLVGFSGSDRPIRRGFARITPRRNTLSAMGFLETSGVLLQLGRRPALEPIATNPGSNLRPDLPTQLPSRGHP